MIPTEAPHKNIEVKARIRDYEKLINEVQALCLSHGETIQQEDVFFKVPTGRLKLRKRAVSLNRTVLLVLEKIFFLNMTMFHRIIRCTSSFITIDQILKGPNSRFTPSATYPTELIC